MKPSKACIHYSQGSLYTTLQFPSKASLVSRNSRDLFKTPQCTVSEAKWRYLTPLELKINSWTRSSRPAQRPELLQLPRQRGKVTRARRSPIRLASAEEPCSRLAFELDEAIRNLSMKRRLARINLACSIVLRYVWIDKTGGGGFWNCMTCGKFGTRKNYFHVALWIVACY